MDHDKKLALGDAAYRRNLTSPELEEVVALADELDRGNHSVASVLRRLVAMVRQGNPALSSLSTATEETDQGRCIRLEGELRRSTFDLAVARADAQQLRARYPYTAESLGMEWAARDPRGKEELLLELQNMVTALLRHDLVRAHPHRDVDRAREVCSIVGRVWGIMCKAVIDDGAAPFTKDSGLVMLAARYDALCAAQGEEDRNELRRLQASRRVDAGTTADDGKGRGDAP